VVNAGAPRRIFARLSHAGDPARHHGILTTAPATFGKADQARRHGPLMMIAAVGTGFGAPAGYVATCRTAAVTPTRASAIASQVSEATDPISRARRPWT